MGWDTTSIVYITCEAITGFVTIVGNSVVLIAIIKTHQLHTVTNVFIGNLAVADIFVGLIVAPLAALSFLGLPKDVYGCIFINCAILMFTNISILMLLGVAVERFIAIRLPFVYNRLLTFRRALWLNGGIWILGSLLGLIPLYGWNIAPDDLTSCSFTGVISMEYMVYFQFFGLVVVPIAIMLCIYSYILWVIRKHAKRTDTLQKMFRKHRRSGTQWKKEVRAAKFFALLIILFAVFWLPVNIMNCFTLFCPSCYQPFQLLLAAIVMSHANSSINPFLYAASNSRIQRSIKGLFSTKRGLEESSCEFASAKYNSGIRGGGTHARQKSLSVIGAHVNEGFLNSVRGPASENLPRKSSDEVDNRNSPELRQLSPMSLASFSNGGSEAFRHDSERHVLENSSDVHTVEATIVANKSGINRSQETSPFSDIVPSDLSKYDKYTQERVSDNDRVTALQQDITTSSTSPKTDSGHINFGYIDDKSNGRVPSLTHSPVRELSGENPPGEGETFTDITSGNEIYNTVNHSQEVHLIYSTGNDRPDDQMLNTDTGESPLKTSGQLQNVADTVAVRKELRHMGPLGTKPRLFEMEDEPSLEQDSNTFTFVTSENDDNGNMNRDKETAEKSNSNLRTSVVHSYFGPRNDINGSKMSDVEIYARDIFTNIETEQTKL